MKLNKEKVEFYVNKIVRKELIRLGCSHIHSKVKYDTELKVCIYTETQGENDGWIQFWSDFFHKDCYSQNVQSLLKMIYEVTIFETKIAYEYLHDLNPLFLT